MHVRSKFTTITTLGLAVLLAACSNSGGGGGADNADGESGSTFEGRGPITYVGGKDNSGKLVDMFAQWNEEHPNEQVTMIELSTSADEQRSSMINNAQTKSDAYCVLSLDNIWVSEFAANQWVEPLPEEEFEKEKFLQPAWDTGVYRGTLYALPHSSDGGVLYYRKDILEEAGITEPASTWEEMYEHWEKVRELDGHEDIHGWAGQLNKYEGLTVNAAEHINTAGGSFFDDEGNVVADSPETVSALARLQQGFEDSFIPEEALTYMEEEGRAAFEDGRIIYYRNWPYQFSLSREKLGDDAVGVAPLPEIDGHPWASSLGGHNSAISKFCENKATALDFVKWYSAAEQQQYALDYLSLAPVWTELYEDETNIENFGYLPALQTSISDAVPRPKAVKYGDVTAAIQDAVFPVLKGDSSPEDGAKELQSGLEKASVK